MIKTNKTPHRLYEQPLNTEYRKYHSLFYHACIHHLQFIVKSL